MILRRGKVTEEEINRCVLKLLEISTIYHSILMRPPAITIATLSNRARRIKRLFGLSRIVVDLHPSR